MDEVHKSFKRFRRVQGEECGNRRQGNRCNGNKKQVLAIEK